MDNVKSGSPKFEKVIYILWIRKLFIQQLRLIQAISQRHLKTKGAYKQTAKPNYENSTIKQNQL